MKDAGSIIRYTVIAGIYLTLIIPFLVSQDLYFPYITLKGYSFRVIVEIIFGLWVVLAFVNPLYRPKKSLLLWSLIGFLAITLIANLQGADIEKSIWSNFERMEGWITLVHIFAYFVVAASVFITEKSWTRFFQTSVVLSLGHAFIAVMQKTGSVETGFGISRADAYFGNPIYLAVFMLFHVFITLYLLVRHLKHTDKKWEYYHYLTGFYILAIVLQIITIALTETRGTMLGLAGGLGLTFLSIALFGKQYKTLRKVAISAIAIIIVLAGIIVGAKDSAFVQNVPIFKRLANISVTDSTTYARFINWDIAWEASKERPLLGYGQGNYGPIFDAGYDPRLWNQEQFFDRTHNIFLDWLIAGGWLALLAYLSLFGVTLYYVLRPNSTFDFLEKSILVGLLAGYFVHNIFVFDNLTSYMYFALILGYVHMRSAQPLITTKRQVTSNTTFGVVALLAVIFIGASIYGVNAASFKENTAILRGLKLDSIAGVTAFYDEYKSAAEIGSYGQTELRSQMLSFVSQKIMPSQLPDAIKQKYIALAFENIEKEIDEHPDNSRFIFIAAQFAAVVGRYEQALEYITIAEDLSPRKQLVKQVKVQLLLVLNRTEEAVALAEENYALYPDNTDAWSQLIRALGTVGDTGRINELVEESYERGGAGVIAMLKADLAANPNNPQAYASLATAYVQLGREQEAIAVFRKLANTIPDAKEQAEASIAQIEAGTLLSE